MDPDRESILRENEKAMRCTTTVVEVYNNVSGGGRLLVEADGKEIVVSAAMAVAITSH